ncbi:hypothetical protein M0D69_24800, partial [Caballeronia sp. SEWSISQ10-4 2]|uniref:hypothetical protein n=1 Tax=Caballeronia sp. SEWSISQ10-4 2 TaxID=2937438 RepID=UPI00264EF5A8
MMLMVGVSLTRRERFATGRHIAPRNALGAARVVGVQTARRPRGPKGPGFLLQDGHVRPQHG